MEHVIPSFQQPSPNGAAVSNSIQTSKSSVRVWIVDDNEQMRLTVAELLSRFGGIECVRHFSSPDALLSTLASKPGPDVILLDCQMGDRNGLDAVRPIKSLTRSTRVLMYTTANNRAWRERALYEGASDYLLKSSAIEHIVARIRNPSEDPAPGFAGRRRADSASGALDKKPSLAGSSQNPRMLTHALRMLRIFSN